MAAEVAAADIDDSIKRKRVGVSHKNPQIVGLSETQSAQNVNTAELGN